MPVFDQRRAPDVPVILFLLFLFVAVKKSRKAQRPLKKQISSPNFQLKDKAVKVSQKLWTLVFIYNSNCPWAVIGNNKTCKLLMNIYYRINFCSLSLEIILLQWVLIILITKPEYFVCLSIITAHIIAVFLCPQSQSRDNNPFMWVLTNF